MNKRGELERFPLENDGLDLTFSSISVNIKTPIQTIMFSPPERRIKTYLSTKKTHLGIDDTQRLNLIETALNTADYSLAAFVIDDNQYSLHQKPESNISFFDTLLKHLLQKRQHEKDYPFSNVLNPEKAAENLDRIASLLKTAYQQNERCFLEKIQHEHFQFLEPLTRIILNSPSAKKRKISFNDEFERIEYEPGSPEPEISHQVPTTMSPIRREVRLETYPRSILFENELAPISRASSSTPLLVIPETSDEEDDVEDHQTRNSYTRSRP